jgi:hypothetical protein
MTDDELERERQHQREAAQSERLFAELWVTRRRRAIRSRQRLRQRGIATEAERAAERRSGDRDR